MNGILKMIWRMKIDPEKCTGCGNCVAACPFGLLEIDRR